MCLQVLLSPEKEENKLKIKTVLTFSRKQEGLSDGKGSSPLQ